MAYDEFIFSLSSQWVPGFAAALIVLVYASLYSFFRDEKPYSGLPLYGKRNGEFLNTKAKERFRDSAKTILKHAMKENNGKPFQVMTDTGPIIFLNASYSDEIRNDHRFGFTEFLHRLFLTKYSGLEGVILPVGFQNDVLKATVRKNLTQSLGAITNDLAEEVKSVIHEQLGAITGEAWSGVTFAPVANQIAARLSNRVFMGKKLGAEQEWLKISIMYAIDVQTAAQELRIVPPFARWLVHWFMPSMKRCREHIRVARRLIEPEITARYKERRNEMLSGKPTSKSLDAINWFMDNAGNEPYDFALAQIVLASAAIHTTTGMLLGLLYDLAQNPEIANELRKEIIQVLQEDGGWKKTTLYKMKLLDSCMKESQRLNPAGTLLINRVLLEEVTLSDGTRLPKDSIISIPSIHMRDKEIFGENADKFDGYRFLHMRGEMGYENKWQFVTTSPEMYGFGHGTHACPGRFFVSNEIKIAIAHLLLMFDWKFDEKIPRPKSLAENIDQPDPNGKIWCRARVPELVL